MLMVVCSAVLASGFMHLNRTLVLLISDLPFYILPVNFLLWKRRPWSFTGLLSCAARDTHPLPFSLLFQIWLYNNFCLN